MKSLDKKELKELLNLIEESREAFECDFNGISLDLSSNNGLLIELLNCLAHKGPARKAF